MKKCREWALVAGLLLLLAVGPASCSDHQTNGRLTATRPSPSTPTLTAPSNSSVITANGNIAPSRQVKSSFQVGGLVKEVRVEVGSIVQGGQVLARLDDAPFKWSVEDMRLRLEQAELDLARAQRPADPDELAVAEKAVQAAQAALTNARGSVSTTASLAQSALRNAQLAYDYAERDYKHLLDMKSWGYDVEDALKTSQVRLDNARTDLKIAQRNATDTGAGESVLQAQKTLAEAQAKYAALQKLPDPESVRAAQLSVEAAKLALEQAQANLARVDLTAPFTGTVTALMLHPSEAVSAGTPVIELADTTRWRVETNNVGELQMGLVKIGQKALVTVNAFLGQELAGKVVAISPTSIVQHGDTTYTITVELEETKLALRWGMTARVRILAEG